MKTVKMSLATIQGKLSRAEMKNIMAGSGDITCSRSDGNDSYSFTSDNAAFMGGWAGFWDSAGWSVQCSNGYNNGVRYV